MKVLLILLSLLFVSEALATRCGNGIREGAEECDNGSNNSDSKPNACRSSCEKAHCGDAVVDKYEECDRGHWENHNLISGRCRTNCKRAGCGDGVVDYTLGEQCDDDRFGCTDCFKCVKPVDDLSINQGYDSNYVALCAGGYHVLDKNNNGVIRLTGDNLILDCSVATLRSAYKGEQKHGVPGRVQQIKNMPRQKKVIKKPPQKTNKLPFKPLSFNFISEANASPPTGTVAKRGIGIVVTGNNNTLVNCNVEGFAVGVHLKGQNNTLVNGRYCGNNLDIKNQGTNNQGNNNQCKSRHQWNDASAPNACSKSC